MSTQTKDWSALTQGEHPEIYTNLQREVKVKLENGRVFSLNPTTKMRLNMNIENEQILSMLKNSKNAGDLEDCDEEYKQQLIHGYKICKNKQYYFKTVEEEENYFSRADVTAEEEVYYYEFIVNWSEQTMTLSELKFFAEQHCLTSMLNHSTGCH